MGLQIFADHCIPGKVIRALKEAGHEVLILKDYLPQDAPDKSVIAAAQREEAILLSLNGDFSDIVAFPPSDYKGIIALQIKNRTQGIEPLLSRLISYMERNSEQDLYKGLLILVEAHRIRIKK